jgi:hypothetical protein
MADRTEVERRKEELVNSLQSDMRYALNKARIFEYSRGTLMGLGLASTVIASVVGIFTVTSSKTVGGIAALYAVFTSVIAALKLDSAIDKYRRKFYGFRKLLSRANWELPEEFTIEDVAAISRDRSRLNDEIQNEQEGNTGKNSTSITPQSNVSSAAPNPARQDLR